MKPAATPAEATGTLSVFRDGVQLGTLRGQPEFGFAYTPGYLAAPAQGQVGGLPLRAGWQTGADVVALFENLLPEGRMRELLQIRVQTPPHTLAIRATPTEK